MNELASQLFRNFLRSKKYLYLIEKHNNRLNCVLQNTIPNISFTKEEEVYGFKLINKLGIPNDCQFVCINNRDSAYLDSTNPFPNIDWSYHKFRDFSIKDFKLTIDKLIQRGYFVIRMGSIVKGHLNYSDKRYIDYSNSIYQSDFLDIFLSSKCKFFISSDFRPIFYCFISYLKILLKITSMFFT